MVNVIKNNNLDAVNSSAYALIDFNATWCGPCKMIAPLVDELSEELAGQVDFFSCDTDENMQLAMKFSISSIPSLVLLKNGEPVDMIVGFRPKEALKEFILSHK